MIFTAGVDLVIFGKDLFLAVSFNLRDPVGSLRATSDKSTEWYKDKTNQKDATDTETDYYDSPNPFVDLEMSGVYFFPLYNQTLKPRNEVNDHQPKTLLIIDQILLVSTLENV